MDIMKSKAAVTSGLFGLITAKLEDAHGVSIIGQGNLTDVGRQMIVNELRTARDEIAILLSAVELL